MIKIKVAFAAFLLTYLTHMAHAGPNGTNGFTLATNPSVGTTGTAAPSSATLVGGSDGANIRAMSVDSTGKLNLLNISGVVSLPTGASTASLQSTGNTSLASILSALVLPSTLGQKNMANSLACTLASDQSTLAVSAASLPLPAGAATSALQTTGNTALTTINTTLGSPFQSGGSIGNTGFSINGTLPAFAATPTFNLGTLGGAATAAKQPALGTAGSASTDVITVQGIASMTALKVDASATTQPVSGTVAVSSLPAIPAGANAIGSVTVTSDKAPVNATGSGGSGTVSTVITLTAPASTVGFILQNLAASTANIRFIAGGTASASSGISLAPGQDSGFIPSGANISVVAESGTQSYSYQFVGQ